MNFWPKNCKGSGTNAKIVYQVFPQRWQGRSAGEPALIPELRSTNGFLASLPDDEFELIRPHLLLVELKRSSVLIEVGDPFQKVFLPHSGIISIVVSLLSGERVEVAMVGRDSLLGAFSTLGDPRSLGEATAITPVVAAILNVNRLRDAVNRSEHMRQTLVRHGQALFAQAQQSAACNAAHAVEKRLARCLLRICDLSGSNDFILTQQQIGEMIGARRNSVSLVASTLQEVGYIHYSRGHISILNPTGLLEMSCECYGAVKTQYERLLTSDL
jgi:CRP-like cAMP-binding protein